MNEPTGREWCDYPGCWAEKVWTQVNSTDTKTLHVYICPKIEGHKALNGKRLNRQRSLAGKIQQRSLLEPIALEVMEEFEALNKIIESQAAELADTRENAAKWQQIEDVFGPDDGIHDPGDLTPAAVIAAFAEVKGDISHE